jgi:hypothetical protein
MELLVDLLTSPKLWAIITPAGMVTAILGYALYKMFLRYDKLQEQRISEWKQMREEYTHLCTEVNKTLDTVLKVIGNRNSNGGSK